MNYYIITGTSRGLGEAIVKGLIRKDNHLFCISRGRNEDLICEAEKVNCPLEYIEYDLSSTDNLDTLVEGIFKKINTESAESICLINNAAVVNPVKPAGRAESREIESNMKINAIAPMILSSGFISKIEDFCCKKTIINISSGAGRNPYSGWSSYCSSKAALDMYTKCVGLEQVSKEYPVKIISFAPGIIDTEMQAEIRRTKTEDFNLVERFKKYKEDGHLKDSNFVAAKVIELINSEKVETGSLLDIREMQDYS
jgi:benzil reductase ((S)-benzoin forming)